jgi:hypothetical protein
VCPEHCRDVWLAFPVSNERDFFHISSLRALVRICFFLSGSRVAFSGGSGI